MWSSEKKRLLAENPQNNANIGRRRSLPELPKWAPSSNNSSASNTPIPPYAALPDPMSSPPSARASHVLSMPRASPSRMSWQQSREQHEIDEKLLLVAAIYIQDGKAERPLGVAPEFVASYTLRQLRWYRLVHSELWLALITIMITLHWMLAVLEPLYSIPSYAPRAPVADQSYLTWPQAAALEFAIWLLYVADFSLLVASLGPRRKRNLFGIHQWTLYHFFFSGANNLRLVLICGQRFQHFAVFTAVSADFANNSPSARSANVRQLPVRHPTCHRDHVPDLLPHFLLLERIVLAVEKR